MAGPKYDIVTVRKDEEDQTFTDYKGEERTSKYRKVGAVWDRDGKLSISFETPITQEDIDECWFNCFARDKQEGGKKAAAKQPAGKKTTTKQPPARKPVGPKKNAPPPEEPGDEEDPFAD